MRSAMNTFRDQAFYSYAQLKQNSWEPAVSFIREAGGEIRQDEKISGLEAAYWLWIIGEYTKKKNDLSLLTEMRLAVDHAVQVISRDWNKPEAHWLNLPGRAEAIYLSNLAIMYGAVMAVQSVWKEERMENGCNTADLQRLLKDMRELLFARMIKDGRVVSQLGSREIYGDIVLAAIPFGLLGIEDRILIEALFIVEEELIGKGVRFSLDDLYFGGCERPDISCLLSWYYAEKGDISKAKLLLKHASDLIQSSSRGVLPVVDPETALEPMYMEYEQLKNGGDVPESPLAEALYMIALDTLNQALQGKDSTDSSHQVLIKHVPTGTDDPYIHAPHERIPRYPEEGELVFVRTTAVPFRPGTQQVWAEYRVNDGVMNSVPMALEMAGDGEQVWQACLGRFRFADEVNYRFKLDEADMTTYSKNFAFQVRSWKTLGQPDYVYSDNDGVLLQFASLPGMTALPTLRFARSECDSLDVRLEWMKEELNTVTWTERETVSDKIVLSLDHYTLELYSEQEQLKWHIYNPASSTICRSAQEHGIAAVEVQCDGSGRAHKVRINLELQSGENIYGMGERYTRMEYRGYSLDNHVYNEYRSQGLKTYMPVPFYISSAGYGCFLDTTMYSRFHFGSQQSDLLTIEADLSPSSAELSMHLFLGDPLLIIRQLTTSTAKPVLPPKWAFGPWMSSNNWDSQAEVMKQVELTNKYEIPSTVIVLEQWSDEATFYIFNDAQYNAVHGSQALSYNDFMYPEWGRWPDPRRMVEELHENGLKVLLWQIPIQKYMYGIAHEQKDNDEKYMLQQDYHVHHTDGRPYRIPYNWFKDCLVIDFTNKEGRKWWFSKRQYLLDEVGIDGFKTDGGECILGHDLSFADGTSGPDMHNRYPLDYVGSYYDFVQEHTGGEGLTFSRSGYSGAQKYPMHWAGDERSTYDAFRASIIAGLTSGMSGIPFWGWDLGGFHGDIPTAELFIRSTQMAAFCPVMQYHAETKGEHNQDRTPWNIADRTGKPEVIGLYKRYADTRMNILPYIYAEAMHSSKTGEPMMRAMFVEFPEERACASLTTQYMFGGSLLVAPVTDEGHYSKRVYFPKGQWISLFNDRHVDGGCTAMVEADLDHIPVFIRQDHVIPLNLNKELVLGSHVGNAVDRYERLSFMMYLVQELDYSFQDDLGNIVSVHGARKDQQIELIVTGTTESPVYWILRDPGDVQSVTVNGTEMERVNQVELLNESRYCIRGKDMVLQSQPGEQKMVIHLQGRVTSGC